MATINLDNVRVINKFDDLALSYFCELEEREKKREKYRKQTLVDHDLNIMDMNSGDIKFISSGEKWLNT